MLGSYSLYPKKQQRVSHDGKLVTMPDGSTFRRTVLPSPAAVRSKTDQEIEQTLEELNEPTFSEVATADVESTE